MQSACSRDDVSSVDNKDTQRPTVQSFPQMLAASEEGGAPAGHVDSTYCHSMSNEFHSLLLEEPLLSEENPQFSDDPSEVHFAGGLETSNASRAKDYELLRLNSKINGCQAHMLLDSGSTHDFVSTEIVRRYKIPTEPRKGTFKVTLPDGTSSEHQHQVTQQVKIVVRDFSEQRRFTMSS